MKDGEVVSAGTLGEALSRAPELVQELVEDEVVVEDEEKPEEVKGGKLVVPEEKPVGRVSWRACAFPFLCYLVWGRLRKG